MKPTAYKIGEGERKLLSKDMQEVILAYEEENKKLDEGYQIARDRVIELLGDIKEYLKHIKELEEENRKLKEDIGKLVMDK